MSESADEYHLRTERERNVYKAALERIAGMRPEDAGVSRMDIAAFAREALGGIADSRSAARESDERSGG